MDLQSANARNLSRLRHGLPCILRGIYVPKCTMLAGPIICVRSTLLPSELRGIRSLQHCEINGASTRIALHCIALHCTSMADVNHNHGNSPRISSLPNCRRTMIFQHLARHPRGTLTTGSARRQKLLTFSRTVIGRRSR
jgi:hypothetical protein